MAVFRGSAQNSPESSRLPSVVTRPGDGVAGKGAKLSELLLGNYAGPVLAMVLTIVTRMDSVMMECMQNYVNFVQVLGEAACQRS
jgi:hypothetical protein